MKKMNLFTPAKKTAFYAGVFVLGLSLTNCSNDDDNTPEEFEFEEQFEDIGEMPDLNIEEITLEEVDLGGVEQSEATANVLSDLEAGGELSADTQANLNTADINSDNQLNVQDIVILINFILDLSIPNNTEFAAADINDDGILNVLDVVNLVNLILG